MRVALVCPYAWDRPGGVQSHVAGLARALEGRGHECSVVAPVSRAGAAGGRGPGAPGEDGGAAVQVVAAGRAVGIPFNGSIAPLAFGPVALASVRRHLRVFAPDVVHVHEPFSPSASLLALVGSRAPVVATFHAAGAPSPLVAAARLLEPLGRKIAVRCAVSQAACRYASRYLPGDYEITPNGIELAAFAGAEPLDLGPGRHVLFVGRLERRKGLEVLVRAMSAVGDVDADLVVAGAGPEEERCRRLAAALGVKARFLGAPDDATKARLYAAADVFCAPNLGGESFGIVVVEAMAAGAPVVCSDIEGFREAAGDAARFVYAGRPGPLAGALRKVLLDDAERQRLRARGRSRAAELDWGRLVARVEELYERAVARPVAPSRR